MQQLHCINRWSLIFREKYHSAFHEFKVLGVISFYAHIDLYDFHKRQIDNNKIIEYEGISVDLLKEVNGSEPYFYLLHGKLDSHIPIEYTIRFSDTLKGKGVNYIMDLVEDGIHSIDFY